jgi:deoxyribodipyrimidine photolyase-related protein
VTRRTVVVLGDQLHRHHGALADVGPGDVDVRMVISRAKLAERPWHRQKLHLVLSAMRRFAADLEDEGFAVDLRVADTFAAGLDGAVRPVVMAPSSWDLRQRLPDLGVEQAPNDAYVVGEEGFARWAAGRRALGLEWFYRDVRKRTGWLVEDDGTPAGGEWNHDRDNRRPPPAAGVRPPPPWRPVEDEVDRAVRAEVAGYERDLGLDLYGSADERRFPTSRAEALASLEHFVHHRLPGFGPLEDAVVHDEPFLWHSMLSVPLNYGLLHPREVCEAVDRAWRTAGRDGRPELPVSSAEGFLRQVAGWREYVWGLYWHRMPGWRSDNHLGHTGPVPEAYWTGETDMACVAGTVGDLLERGWTHHIPRLMVLGGYALLAGVDPQELSDWFFSMYVDGFDWVMVPNVIGMSQWADGGVMASKPYASTARYIDRMTTYCEGCRFDASTRVEDDSCPFNSLYWDFLARHRRALSENRRMAPILSTLDRFDPVEREAIHRRARLFRTDVAPGR